MINDRYFHYHFSTLNYHLKEFQVAIAQGFHLFPIPNREVKPCHADGTAFVGE